MPIEFWIFLWKLVLIGGVALFAALAVVVTIGGARDVRKLLRKLREQQDDIQSNAPPR
ncbi:hypothetical protein OAS39_05800 [Pirellulales bacterium]|nr:hypothetical protein [Pirellulales bacterium]